MKKIEIISISILNILIIVAFGLILSNVSSYDWALAYPDYNVPEIYNITLVDYFKNFGIFFIIYSLLEIGTLIYKSKDFGIIKPNNVYYIMSVTGLIYNLCMYVTGYSFAGLRYSVQVDDNTKTILYDLQYISDIKKNLLLILLTWIVFSVIYIFSKKLSNTIFSSDKCLKILIGIFAIISILWFGISYIRGNVSNPNTLTLFGFSMQYSAIIKAVIPVLFSWLLYYQEIKINKNQDSYKPISNLGYIKIFIICLIPIMYLAFVLKEKGNAICIFIVLFVMLIYNTITIKFPSRESSLSCILKYIILPSAILTSLILMVVGIFSNILIGNSFKILVIMILLVLLAITSYMLINRLKDYFAIKIEHKSIDIKTFSSYINNCALGWIITISLGISCVYIFNVALPNTYKEALNLTDTEISSNIVEKRRNEVSTIKNTSGVDDIIIQNKLESLDYNYKPYDINTIYGNAIYDIGRLIYPQQNEQHISINSNIRDTLMTGKKIQDQQAIENISEIHSYGDGYVQRPTTAQSDYMLYTLSVNNSSILTLICIVLGYTLQFAPLIILYNNRSIKLVGLNTLQYDNKLRVIYMFWNVAMMYVISFIVQAFVNILGVYGMIFYTGISLPFISDGTCDMLFFLLEFLFISCCVLDVDKIKCYSSEE